MYLKRAIGMSLLAYVASLFVGLLVTMVFEVDLGQSQAIPPIIWYAGAFASVIFGIVFTILYFQSPKTKPSLEQGMRFGLVMIATGFVMDFISFLPLLAHEDPFGPILSYYTDPLFWLSLGLILASTTITGRHLEKRATPSP